MGKGIGLIYKHGSDYQKSYLINSIRTCVYSIIEKYQTSSVLCSQNTIQNDLNITNNDDIQSCETPIKNYSIPTTSTPKNHAQPIGAMQVHSFNSHTTVKFPPLVK